MKTRLIKKEIIAEGTLYMEFAGEEKSEFVPGQFFRLTLTDPKYTDERGNRRFLGFVNLPNDQNEIASVMRLGPSAFKRTLFDSEPGMEAEIDGADGKMTWPDEIKEEIVIVTGGIGIAPIISLLRWEKERTLGHKLLLIYSNTNRRRAIFLPELADYEKQNPNFSLIATMTQDGNWGGERRRIGTQFLKESIKQIDNKLFYVTGTPRFVPDMVRHLRDLGVNPLQIKFEIFTGY